eukprot:TRINITY_DN27169_c0_g1_i1.p1 TRINITY_DN27169_c0_g1~~TRINITY_DN27169_c0_g1_i1.p1  ORF type:complete len:108 (+),score=13.07 TRINITY_DN27169_c0_g1_i1:136-459(+)
MCIRDRVSTQSTGLDYAGAHNGPGGYHYHLESADVPENTTLSFDDEKLVGIMADGFLLYGRKCNSNGNHPSNLDASGGHTSSTQHSDGAEFYPVSYTHLTLPTIYSV